MTYLEQFKSDVANSPYTQIIRIKHLIGSVSNTDFDDAQVMTQSGNDVYTSGICFPIKATRGSTDAVLLEQGRITQNDKKIYIAGDVATTDIMKIGLGSPVYQEHSIIEKGVISYPPTSNGDYIYKQMFCQELSNGSYIGEY